MEDQVKDFNNFEEAPAKPNNNMAIAIVGTIFGCCSTCGIGFVVGVIGIVMATQVNSKYNNGDYEGAKNSAKYAKILGFVALALFVLNLIYVAFSWSDPAFQEQIETIMEQVEAIQNQS